MKDAGKLFTVAILMLLTFVAGFIYSRYWYSNSDQNGNRVGVSESGTNSESPEVAGEESVVVVTIPVELSDTLSESSQSTESASEIL